MAFLQIPRLHRHQHFSKRVGTTKEGHLEPTNLLAIIPLKTNEYPTIQTNIDEYPINYFMLTILDENGNNPNFGGKPFRIGLRVAH